MSPGENEAARRWLAEQGVRRTGDGTDTNDIAHTWTWAALTDLGLDAAERLRLGFGLLDLLGEYWVLCEIRFALADQDDPLPADAFWDGCRRRLESADEPEPLTYALWVDSFEDRTTVETAFAEVLGDDVAALPRGERPLLLRAGRVPRVSGPVPWAVKYRAYETAARVPGLHGALFHALLAGYHDVYGDLEPGAALALLRRLDLPAGTEHVAELTAVLEAGHRNHRAAPEAWANERGRNGP